MASTKRGFTLVELLVVIAVIAILAGILFPVYAGVRRKAEQTACASNLRQIGLAYKSYLSDHKSRGANWGGTTVGNLWTIATDWRGSDGTVDFREGLGDVCDNLRKNYAGGDRNIFFCPHGLYDGMPDLSGTGGQFYGEESTFDKSGGAVTPYGEVGYGGVMNWLAKDGDMYRALVTNGSRFRRLGNAAQYVSYPLDTTTCNATEVCVMADVGLLVHDDKNEFHWPHDEVGNVLFLDGSVKNMAMQLFIDSYAPVPVPAAWALPK